MARLPTLVSVSSPILLALVAAGSPAQAFAVKRLDDSPRHHEWMDIAAGGRTVRAFAAFPEREQKTPAIVVVHENRGLTDWVRLFCDELAAAGYLAVAPDLLSQFDDDHADTAAFASSDAARKAIYQLPPERVGADLDAVVNSARGLPACDGRTAVVGFCWGGARAFELAASERVQLACVFYGSPPDDAGLQAVRAPVHGFYGRDDQRINATIDATATRMRELGKTYQPEVYDGAGHAFMRIGDDPESDAAVRAARDRAMQRLLRLLAAIPPVAPADPATAETGARTEGGNGDK